MQTALRDKQPVFVFASVFVLSGQVSQQRQHMCHCLTMSARLSALTTLQVNMWLRRVLCVFTELHLHAFTIPDAGSHPA